MSDERDPHTNMTIEELLMTDADAAEFITGLKKQIADQKGVSKKRLEVIRRQKQRIVELESETTEHLRVRKKCAKSISERARLWFDPLDLEYAIMMDMVTMLGGTQEVE